MTITGCLLWLYYALISWHLHHYTAGLGFRYKPSAPGIKFLWNFKLLGNIVAFNFNLIFFLFYFQVTYLMRQSQGQKKPLQKSTLYEREKKKKHTQDLNAVFNHLAVLLTQHGSLHVSHPCGSLQNTEGNINTKQYRNPRLLPRYHIT